MAHWAEINEDNTVHRVVVMSNDKTNEGYDWLVENLGGTWIKTSYNTQAGVHYSDLEEMTPSDDQSKAFRKNFAGIGFIYDEARDAFLPPKPHESWVVEEETCLWIAPVPMPDDADTVAYLWDEASQNWIAD